MSSEQKQRILDEMRKEVRELEAILLGSYVWISQRKCNEEAVRQVERIMALEDDLQRLERHEHLKGLRRCECAHCVAIRSMAGVQAE